MSILSQRNRLRELIEPTVTQVGYELVAVEVLGSARRPILRVSIDGPTGVDVDDCARVSRRLGPVLDESDPISGTYDLEVSSPGIDRPVQRLQDFVRFAGYRARVVMIEGMPRRRFAGVLQGVEGDTVRIDVEGEVFDLAFPDIEKCQLVLDLKEYQAIGLLTRGSLSEAVLALHGEE